MAPNFTLLKYDVVGDGSTVSLGDGSRDTGAQASLNDSIGSPETAGSDESIFLDGSCASLKGFTSDESGLLDGSPAMAHGFSETAGDSPGTAGTLLLASIPAMAHGSPETAGDSLGTAGTLLLASIPTSIHSLRSTFLP